MQYPDRGYNKGNRGMPSISAMAQYPSNTNSQSNLAELNILQKNRSNQNLNSYSPKKVPPPNIGDYNTNIIRKNPPRNRLNHVSKIYNQSDRNQIGQRYAKPAYQRNLPSITSTNNDGLKKSSILEKNMSILNTSVETKGEENNHSIVQ